jgi:hypothetical protein
MHVDKNLSQLIARDITNFETTEDVAQRQADMLRRLERSRIAPCQYASMADCRPNYCAYKKCLEACWFGTRNRRFKELPAVYDLLQGSDEPLFEVRCVRGMWAQPSGQLRYAPISAAKRVNRRALDKLFVPTLIAVGAFKVSVETLYDRHQWICEIHQIVAGATREELEKVLSCRGVARLTLNKVSVRRITDLGQTISRVFRRDLEGWRDPAWSGAVADAPTKSQRREFYKWLLGLRPGTRLIRYGCDKHFNRLHKKARTFHVTVRKPRPYRIT